MWFLLLGAERESSREGCDSGDAQALEPPRPKGGPCVPVKKPSLCFHFTPLSLSLSLSHSLSLLPSNSTCSSPRPLSFSVLVREREGGGGLSSFSHLKKTRGDTVPTQDFLQHISPLSLSNIAAVAMASCRRRSKWDIVHQAPQSIEFGGLFCDCPDSGEKNDQFWTRIECNSLGKTLEWCYRRTQFVCNAEEQSSVFRTECLERGDGCQVHVC